MEQIIITQIQSLLGGYEGEFAALGMQWFRWIGIILWIWVIGNGLFAAARGHGFATDPVWRLLVQMCICYTILRCYASPLPGVGLSFPQVITGQTAALAQKLQGTTATDIGVRIAKIKAGMEPPSGSAWLTDAGQIIRYNAIGGLLDTVRGATSFVIAFGFIAQAVIILLGPLMIPWMLVPGVDGYFKSWLDGLIQYSFYPVVANAFVLIWGGLMLHFLDQWPAPWDAAKIQALMGSVIVLSVAFIWGVLKVPALTAGLFSGRSGEHALPGLGWWR